MSRSRNTLLVIAMVCAAGCGLPTSNDHAVTSDSRLSLRVDPGPELNGTRITYSAGDSLIVRASVVGDAGAYDRPIVSASDPSMVERRADGSARVLRPGSIALTATAAAISARTRPALLQASGTLDVSCTTSMLAGLGLTIVDSASGAAPSGPGVMRLRVTDGAWTDSLRTVTLIGNWASAWERAGTYTVTVDADGYRPWRLDGVVVTRGLCHVRPTRVTARLVRQ